MIMNLAWCVFMSQPKGGQSFVQTNPFICDLSNWSYIVQCMPPQGLCCILQIMHNHKFLANTVNLNLSSCLSRNSSKDMVILEARMMQTLRSRSSSSSMLAISRKSGGVERKGWLTAPPLPYFQAIVQLNPYWLILNVFLIRDGWALPKRSNSWHCQDWLDYKSRVATGSIFWSIYQTKYQSGGHPTKACECDTFTTKVRRIPFLGGNDLITANCKSIRCSAQGCCCLQHQGE